MMNNVSPQDVRDLRVTLNEAQDFGQEALVLVHRSIIAPDDERAEFFAREADRFTRAAINRARTFVAYAVEFGKQVR